MRKAKEIRREVALAVAAAGIAFSGNFGAERAIAQDGGDEEHSDTPLGQVVPPESPDNSSDLAEVQTPGVTPTKEEETSTWSIKEAVETGNLEEPLSPELQRYYEERVAVSSPYLVAQLPGTDILYDVADIQPQLLELRELFAQRRPDVPLNRPVGFQVMVVTDNEKDSYIENILPQFRRAAIENQTGTQVFNPQTHTWESLNISENSIPPTIVVFHPVANMEQSAAEMGIGDRQHIVSSRKTQDIHMLKTIEGGVLTIHMFVGKFDFSGSFPQILMAATRTAWNGSPEIDPYWEDPRRFFINDFNLSYPYILTTVSIDWSSVTPGGEALVAAHPPLDATHK